MASKLVIGASLCQLDPFGICWFQLLSQITKSPGEIIKAVSHPFGSNDSLYGVDKMNEAS